MGYYKVYYDILINGVMYRIGTQHRLYNLRYKMMQRCYNSKPAEFKYYQGKGITVCDEWRNNPESFFTFCLSNGWNQGLHIDRIDPNGNYEPSNVQFVTAYINNRRANAGRRGITSGNVKMTEEQVRNIKRLLRDNVKRNVIAKQLGVSIDIVGDIKRNKTWKHINIED